MNPELADRMCLRIVRLSEDAVLVELTPEATGDDCDGPAAVAYIGEITLNFTINKLQSNHVHEENDRTTVFSYDRETNGTESEYITY